MCRRPATARCSTRSPPGSASSGAWSPTITRPPTRVAETHDADDLERLGELQHALEERDGWRLEQRVELIVSRLALPADRRMQRAVRRLAPARAARQGAGLGAAICCCSTSRPTISTSTRSAGSRSYLRGYRRRAALRDPRPRVPRRARHADRRARSRPLTSWPGSYASYLEKKAAALDAEARELGPARQEARRRKRRGCARASRRGARATKGASSALMALRAERAAYRAQSGTVRMAVDDGQSSGQAGVRGGARVASRSADVRSSATTRSGSCAAIASA